MLKKFGVSLMNRISHLTKYLLQLPIIHHNNCGTYNEINGVGKNAMFLIHSALKLSMVSTALVRCRRLVQFLIHTAMYCVEHS